MTKAKLWLHVGPPKTGTTTLQRFMRMNRGALRKVGIVYPRTPDNAHHKAAFAQHFLPCALENGDMKFAADFMAGLPLDAGDIVISSERFERVITLTAELTKDFETTVLYYARDPIDGANSMAQQLIKAGAKTYAQLSEKPPIPPLKATIEKWRAAFGANHVKVRKFARGAFRNGDLIDDFFDAIGHPDAPGGLPRKTHNESISLETAHRIETYRAETGDFTFIKASDPRFRGKEGEAKFSLPNSTLAKVRAKTADDLMWLKSEIGVDL